ncbi:hypothetical protein EB835_02145 [Brevibacterium sp. S22]|nr:hypothetical protein EB835_02145 [Brevibacterium sp. S22]
MVLEVFRSDKHCRTILRRRMDLALVWSRLVRILFLHVKKVVGVCAVLVCALDELLELIAGRIEVGVSFRPIPCQTNPLCLEEEAYFFVIGTSTVGIAVRQRHQHVGTVF